jgi:lipopolysaccharide export LptBFGC system permease protein LptF
VAVVALAFIPFLLSLQRRLALMFVVAGVIYVAGAIVVELLSEELDADSFAYVLAVALEEGLEMLGALLFLYLNLERMQRQQLLRVDVNID